MSRQVIGVVVLSVLLAGCRGQTPTRGAWFEPNRKADTVPVAGPPSYDTNAAVFHTAAPQPQGGLVRARLANGLTVLVRERHEVPLVASILLYHVGSRDEAAGVTGLSHFMEHMMFKGTERLKKGDIDHLTMTNGGRNNAWTNKDFTAYHFVFPSDRWQTALDLEADRMHNCLFDPKEVDSERNVVEEEMRQDNDTPWEELTNRLDESLFGTRGYGHPIIGYQKDLDAVTRDQFFEHYRRWYAPNNAVLVLEGDLDSQEAVRAVKEKFEGIAATELPTRPAEAPLASDGQKRLEVEAASTMPRCMIGFRTCRFTNPDWYALTVAAAVLSNGKSSRLQKSMTRDRQVCHELEMSQDDAVGDSAFYVQAELYPGVDPKAAEGELFDAFARLRSEPVTDAELERAKNLIETDLVMSNQSALDHAELLAKLEGFGSGAEMEEMHYRALRAVTAGDVQRVAAKYLVPENSVVAWTVPGKAKHGSVRRADTRRCARNAGFQARNAGFPARATGVGGAVLRVPPVERWTLANGLTVVFQRRSDVPAVTIDARVRADQRVEPAEKAGLVHLLGTALATGTATRSEDQILEAIEGIGGSLDAEDDEASVKVLSRHFEKGTEVLADVLVNASFPEKGLAWAKKQVEGEIDFAGEDPETLAKDAFHEVVYGTHPYARPKRGYRETVEGITRDDVVAFHKAWYRPNDTILVVCGDVESAAVRAAVERCFGGWQRAELPATTCAPPEEAKAVRKASLEADAEQAVVFLGHLGVARKDADYDALLVMDNVLGTGSGFTDRISKRVRDEMGLAYSCYGNITSSAHEEPGMFAAYLACKPDNEDKAVEAMREVIAQFLAEGPTDEELRDAKTYLKGSRPFKFETIAETASYWLDAEEVGLPADELATFGARIDAVTREDVVRVAKAHLHPERMSMARVGPPRPAAADAPAPKGLKIGATGASADGRVWTLAAWEEGTKLTVRLADKPGLIEVVLCPGAVSVLHPEGVELPAIPDLERTSARRYSAARMMTVYRTEATPAQVLEHCLLALGFRGW